MPPTIQALLAARLDQLEAPEREVAQRAAIVGPLFSWEAVRELCRDSGHGLSSSLHALVRKEVIVPAAGAPGSGDAFRFAHILVRDAAYAGLAKRTRAELHERFAHWVEQSFEGIAGEQEEILGSISSRPPPSSASSATRTMPTVSARRPLPTWHPLVVERSLPVTWRPLPTCSADLPTICPPATRNGSRSACNRYRLCSRRGDSTRPMRTSPRSWRSRPRRSPRSGTGVARVPRCPEGNRDDDCLRRDCDSLARAERARRRSCRSGRGARLPRQDEVLERRGRSCR